MKKLHSTVFVLLSFALLAYSPKKTNSTNLIIQAVDRHSSISLSWNCNDDRCDFFTIERSFDGENFTLIDARDYEAEKKYTTKFNFQDLRQYGQNISYRITGIDHEGEKLFVKTKSIERMYDGTLHVYPQAIASDKSFNVGLADDWKGVVRSKIFNVEGDLVHEGVILHNPENDSQYEFFVEELNLPKGNYHILFENGIKGVDRFLNIY